MRTGKERNDLNQGYTGSTSQKLSTEGSKGNAMINIGIIGASGYTGLRLVTYLAHHPKVNILFITSRAEKGKRFSDLYGALGGICDLPFSDPEEVVNRDIDLLFTCAPDQVSMKVVPGYYDRGVSVIDLAGDYRMDTPQGYETWYGKPHDTPAYLPHAVYGLTELNRERIRTTRLVSNPGCYPTSVILGLAPLLSRGLIDPALVEVHAVSGVSGAGRDLKLFKQFYEADSNVMPYAYGRKHKHVGEMEQELSKLAGESCRVIFAPQVAPLKTGIVSTISVGLREGVGKADLDRAYEEAYGEEFFVRYHPGALPESKFVADTNFCDIGCVVIDDLRRALVVSTICNLGKGASGQAVQNMNVLFGFDEKAGLL